MYPFHASVRVVASFACLSASAQTWIVPSHAGDPLIWGRGDGLVFGLPSEGGLPGPRGLIRVGVISEETHRPELVNFVAIEPVAAGMGTRFSRMAFSELEMSTADPGKRGKRLTSSAAEIVKHGSIETLSVRIDVERFTANGAHTHVVAMMSSDRPRELALSVYQEQDSAPTEELSLTATMGNYERLRLLWLRDRIVDSRRLYADYRGVDFVEHENYVLPKMLRTREGDAIALCTANEANPAGSANAAAKPFWRYRLQRLTQYWRVPAHDIEPDLRVRVNGRRVYWQSHDELPGGVAFENFELRQRYKAGQTFIFGLTSTEPEDFIPPLPHLAAAPQKE